MKAPDLTTPAQRTEYLRRRKTAVSSPWSTPPVALRELIRHDEAVQLFMQGLAIHYADCLASGRLDVWGKCARSVIDLARGRPQKGPSMIGRVIIHRFVSFELGLEYVRLGWLQTSSYLSAHDRTLSLQVSWLCFCPPPVPAGEPSLIARA